MTRTRDLHTFSNNYLIRIGHFTCLLGMLSALNTTAINAAGEGEASPASASTHTATCDEGYQAAADSKETPDQKSKKTAAVRAGKKFFKYFEVMQHNLKERGYLLDVIEQALIAKEGVLIMGPPGTAKSQVADTVLGGIIDEDKVNEKQKEIEKAKERAMKEEAEAASLAAGPSERASDGLSNGSGNGPGPKSSKKNKNRNKKERGQKTLAELDAEPVNSFFRLQLTAETTMSETHGPLNFKKLTEENVYDRKYEDSMLNFKNVFIDEIFDARPNALRNILGILGERAHSQGGRTRKAKLETFIAATNSYLSQVYEKAGNDGPKAVIDRFSFSSFIPGELEKTQSAVTLIQGAKNESALIETPHLTFQELDQIRELVPDVDIPVHVASFLAVLSNQLKEETETLETASLKVYNNALRNGDAAAPPYRASKYHSPRSLGKAAGILKSWVVRDWLKQQLDPSIPPQDKRELKATLQDVKALEQFFTLNGPSDEYVEKLITRANEHERAQLEAIQKERELFRNRYDVLLKGTNDRFYSQVGKHSDAASTANSTAAKKAAAHQLALQWSEEVEPHIPPDDELAKMDGNAIGAQMLGEALSHLGIGLVGDSEWETLTQAAVKAAKEKQNPQAQSQEFYAQTPDMVIKKHSFSAIFEQRAHDSELDSYLEQVKQRLPVSFTQSFEFKSFEFKNGKVTFQMGSPGDDPDHETKETQHAVTLTHPFEIQSTPVTQLQWSLIMGQNLSNRFMNGDFKKFNGVGIALNPQLPVEQITRQDIDKFVTKLNELDPEYEYRLPTEAEWEFSARGGTQTAYSFGDDPQSLKDYAWFKENSGSNPESEGYTHEVATLKENQYGLYDMQGLVGEIVSDFYEESLDSKSKIDPTGPKEGWRYPVRGGYYNLGPKHVRVAARSFAHQNAVSSASTGFRLVRTRRKK